jgi:hypothetical protein
LTCTLPPLRPKRQTPGSFIVVGVYFNYSFKGLQMHEITKSLFWRWLGAVKRQKLFPPVSLTTPIERNDAQTRRPRWIFLSEENWAQRFGCVNSTGLQREQLNFTGAICRLQIKIIKSISLREWPCTFSMSYPFCGGPPPRGASRRRSKTSKECVAGSRRDA